MMVALKQGTLIVRYEKEEKEMGDMRNVNCEI